MKYNDLYQVAPLPGQARYCHEDYALSYIPNSPGTRLQIGDHVLGPKHDILVLVGPYLPFSLESTVPNPASSKGITLRIPADLLGNKLLGKNQLAQVNGLLEQAARGILFTEGTALQAVDRLGRLESASGFDAYLELLSLLQDLAVSPGWTMLSEKTFTRQFVAAEDDYHRIETAFAYMKANYDRPISLADVAGKARMTRGAFCRFIRRRTGKTYVESMNEIRIGHICRMLLETSDSVSEIAYKAGYNNINYFHRWFKRQEGCTPKEFRQRRSVA